MIQFGDSQDIAFLSAYLGTVQFQVVFIIVKLHSELTLPTESQLDRVGVDFVFPPSQQQVSN